MPKIIDLNTFAEGALAERANIELQKILENIADPNTDAKKARKLTLTVTLKGDDKRDLVFASVQAKSTLAPAKEIESKIVIDLDGKGKVTGAELKSGVKGQTFMDEDGDVADDRGTKIINLQQSK